MDYFDFLVGLTKAHVERDVMLSKPIAQPKAKPDPLKRRRTHKQRMQAFVDAVWLRVSDLNGWTNCHYCLCVVRRGSRFFGGEVHHILKRSTHPELKYEPLNGCVVCRDCHRRLHS